MSLLKVNQILNPFSKFDFFFSHYCEVMAIVDLDKIKIHDSFIMYNIGFFGLNNDCLNFQTFEFNFM